MISARALAALCAAGLSASCAQLETEAHQGAIVGGSDSVEDDAVAALLIGGAPYCTGTLVTPSIVVTAAHCLPPHVAFPASSIDVFFGRQVGGPGETIRAAIAFGNPAWDLSQVAGDVGVILLSRPSVQQPAPMLAQPLEMLSGGSVRVVGFGITEADGDGAGRRRSGEMAISSLDDTTIHLSPGPASTCSGDSGGPLFINVGGVDVLAGIHVRSDCESLSLSERVDIHSRGFILDFAEAQGGAAVCQADGLCAEDCASPDPDCLCGADGMCTEDCFAPQSDPDCDCTGGECEPAGCSVALGNRSLALPLFLVALLAWRRRRRHERLE